MGLTKSLATIYAASLIGGALMVAQRLRNNTETGPGSSSLAANTPLAQDSFKASIRQQTGEDAVLDELSESSFPPIQPPTFSKSLQSPVSRFARVA